LLFAWAVVATARRGRPRYLITPENIEMNVRNWLDATEVNVRRLPADANIHFGFEVTTVSGTPLGILRARGDDRYLTFVTRIALSPEHKQVYDGMTEIEKVRMRRSFRLEAAKAKIEFMATPDLTPITIQSRLPITETLTEADFLVAINEVNFSSILVRETLGLALEPPQ
jgi:hypothetical protein